MINVIQRLAFKDVFPEEEPQEIIQYLSKVSSETLLKTIGFCNTVPVPNFDNFFSNPTISAEIYDRVVAYSKKNKIKEKPQVVSDHAALKLAELILSNKAGLIENNTNSSVDNDEINLFKAFLLINSDLNDRQVLDNISEDNFEQLVDYSIIFTFPTADLAIFKNNNLEFLKLIYTTIFKVEYLFDFLNSEPEFENLKLGLIESFNVVSEEEFLKQMKYLFGKLLELKQSNGYLFEVTDDEAQMFLESMVSDEVKLDEDFTHIKNNPLYKLDEKIFSIINFFFVVDKFYRSSKFKLKEVYEKDKKLVGIYGNFFNFFNKEFSENFLMKNILDEIFDKKYFIKKPESETELPGEPDYCVRYNNDVFVFENKDVLVAKSIKASADIEQINNILKTKFLSDGKKSVGIGQIVNTIVEIGNKKFRFDDYVNSKKALTIYPILLVHDRIFQTLGINYRLNRWFKEHASEKLQDVQHSFTIKSLTVIDIDTLILWSPYFIKKDKNFKDVVNLHLDKMNKLKKVNTPDVAEGMYRVKRNLAEQLSPISVRIIPYDLDIQILLDKFKDVLEDD